MRLLSSLLAQTRCNSPCSGIKQQLLAGERVAETCKDASQQPSNRGQESIEYASGRAAKARHTSLASVSRSLLESCSGCACVSCISITAKLRGRSGAPPSAAVRQQELSRGRSPNKAADALRSTPLHAIAAHKRNNDSCHHDAPPHILGLAPDNTAHRVAHRRAAAVRTT